MKDKLVYAWLPGLPHLLRPDLNPSYSELSKASQEIGVEFQNLGVKRILYYSTQWLSVLGQSIQARPKITGLHVDENWYDIASLKFDFRIDLPLVEALVSVSRAEGFQVRTVDYNGFPIDTGTIVADSLINKSGISTGMYSSCVYSDYEESVRIGRVMAKAAESLEGKTALVIVSGLSGRYFTSNIDLKSDRIRNESDDKWNRQILQAMNDGRWHELESIRMDYCRETKADMGLKGLAVLKGAGACADGRKLVTKSYGAIYGTGAAVMLGI